MDRAFYAEYNQIETTHWWFQGRHRIFRELLDERLRGRPAAHLLDVGCGTGVMMGQLEPYGAPVGIDLEAEALGYCRERGCDRLAQGSADALPFADGTFDLVTALDVVEHLDEDVRTLAELRRVCRPDGWVLITVPAYEFLWGVQDEISHHRRRYTRRTLAERLTAAGLRTDVLTYFNTFLFPVIAGVRVGRRAAGRPGRESDFTMTKPGLANTMLAKLFAAEAPLIRSVGLPFGVSILCLARPVSPVTAEPRAPDLVAAGAP